MKGTTLLRTVVGVTFGAQLGLLLWSRTLSPLVLLATAGLLAAAVALEWRRSPTFGGVHAAPGVTVRIALVLLGLALVTAGATTARLEWGERNWEGVVASRDAQLAARLEDRLVGALRRAEVAAERAARAGSVVAQDSIARIQRRTGVDALVRVEADDRISAWAGDHRGRLPAAVLRRDSGIVFPGGTLFDYLYVIVRGPGGARTMAAVLVDAGPPLQEETSALMERFESVTGERPRLGSPDAPEADLRLMHGGEPVLSARFPDVSPAEWRGRVARSGRQVVFGLVLGALALLSAAWLRTLEDRGGPAGVVPIGAFSLTLMVAPLRRTLGLDRLFSPGWFVLPVPGDFVIEGVIVVLLPLAALLATLRIGWVKGSELWLRLAIGSALLGGGFAIGAGVMAASAGVPLLTSSSLWYVLQPTTVVLLTVLGALLIPRTDQPLGRRKTIVFATAGAAISILLGLGIAGGWRPGLPTPTPVLLAWAVPFVLLARAVAPYQGRGDRLVRWLVAGWLAATAVIPHLWVASQQASLERAEAELSSLGARGDPYLSYLLDQMAEALAAGAVRGDRDLDILYEAWVASGLAAEPYLLEVSLWDAELRRDPSLPLGVQVETGSPAYRELLDIVQEVVTTGLPVNAPAGGGGVSRVMAVPLGDGRVVTVAVAPRASLRPTSTLARFLEGGPEEPVTLDLLPAVESAAPADRRIRWQRTDEGWYSETVLREGADVYHAHLNLRMPPAGVRLARGVLLVTLDLLLLTLLWGLGRVARGDPPIPPGGWLGWLSGFRVRLIVALLAFFLLPTAVFGWAAYRALADEVARAARQVAERAVVHAAEMLPQAGLVETARRTGEDLLYFEEGALGRASVQEAVELGLYSAWMPRGLYERMRSAEALSGVERGELAGRSYLVAYRRLRSPERVVGVPVWLAARDVAVRQQEFAHLVVFGVLVGGVLSLALSVLVGRALAQPIAELRRASASVGRGHLRVRLPEERPDEFGDLFASFNQMARRLRRARAQERRTARILAWGEMARQVAHEIKNPLTPIKLSIQHIRRAYRDGRPDFEPILESNVDQILTEIDRLTEIARAFSRYGAPQEVTGSPEPVDVAAVAREVLTLYRAPDRAVEYQLDVRTGAGEAVAGARALELREVLVNLLENARAAVGDEGRVDVVVSAPDGRVRVEVRDDGEGIDPVQLPKIFDPHFSTRSSGTGLGLAIVRRLVESWGGKVGAESEPGVRTAVWLEIPKAGAAPPPEEDDADPDRPAD